MASINHDATVCHGSLVSHFPLAGSSALWMTQGHEKVIPKLSFSWVCNLGSQLVPTLHQAGSKQETETMLDLDRESLI